MNNNVYEIIEKTHLLNLTDQAEWLEWVNKSYKHDFYHSWCYHYLHRDLGTPLFFVYEYNGDFVGFPLLKRPIEGFDYADFTSVYGYCGPLSNLPFNKLSHEFAVHFKYAFLSLLKSERIVSVFSGLNPFMDQTELLKVIGGLNDNGKTVVIDLSVSLDAQRKGYKKRVNNKIQRLRDLGWTVKQSNRWEDLEVFAELYAGNMERCCAGNSYKYDINFLYTILNTQEFDGRLVLVYNENDYAVCGAIVVNTGEVLQAYLLGTREEYRYASPAKLLTEELTVMSRDLGLKYFNLGGGLGFRKDSLFDWKSNFSSLTFDYKTWRYIADKAVYEEILHYHGIDPDDEMDYFPLYRASANVDKI